MPWKSPSQVPQARFHLTLTTPPKTAVGTIPLLSCVAIRNEKNRKESARKEGRKAVGNVKLGQRKPLYGRYLKIKARKLI